MQGDAKLHHFLPCKKNVQRPLALPHGIGVTLMYVIVIYIEIMEAKYMNFVLAHLKKGSSSNVKYKYKYKIKICLKCYTWFSHQLAKLKFSSSLILKKIQLL